MTPFETQPLEKAALLLSGGTPRKASKELWDGDVPWLTPKDMANWTHSTEQSVSAAAIGNGTRLAPEGACFVAVRGMSLHNEIRVVRSDRALTFNQDIKAVVARNGVDPLFLYYAVMGQKRQLLEWVTSAGHGTGVLETDRLKSIRIPIVQRSEQVRIAQTFAAIDDKIELNRRMNETLEAMAQAIFRDWFVDFGPTRRKLEGATDPVTIMGGLVQDADRAEAIADFFPSAIGNDDLPDSWRTRIIYDCCDVKYGAPFASDRFNTVKNGRPLARIRDLPGNVGGVYTDEVHPKEHQIAAGDIVVGMDGEFRAYLWHGEPTLMNQRVCSFVPKPNRSRAFLLFSLRPLLATCEATAVGTTVIHLGKKDIDRFNVVAAPEDLEASFASIVEPMLDLVVSNGAQNRTLAATRDLLLPKLMSGEIRLREAEEMLEAAQ